MFFSVVIPTFNRLDLLKETLATVRAQTFTGYEIIVADSGSTDGTLEWLAAENSDIKSVRSQIPSPGAGRNAGANIANGEYIAFLDSDDVWFPWTLKTFAKLIAQHDQPASLMSRLVHFTSARDLACIHEEKPRGTFFADYFESSVHHYCVGAGTLVVRRDVFTRSGGFDERSINMEDHDLTLRLGIERGFVAVETPVTLGWRRHSDSVTMNAEKTYLGARNLVEKEMSGCYPGGPARSDERRRVITGHTRPATLECLRSGNKSAGWWLYRATLGWNVAQGRLKYVAGFPIKAALAP
jgi:glycosyltransferase involved in cell wall biosynthesis